MWMQGCLNKKTKKTKQHKMVLTRAEKNYGPNTQKQENKHTRASAASIIEKYTRFHYKMG